MKKKGGIASGLRWLKAIRKLQDIAASLGLSDNEYYLLCLFAEGGRNKKWNQACLEILTRKRRSAIKFLAALQDHFDDQIDDQNRNIIVDTLLDVEKKDPDTNDRIYFWEHPDAVVAAEVARRLNGRTFKGKELDRLIQAVKKARQRLVKETEKELNLTYQLLEETGTAREVEKSNLPKGT